MKKMTKEDKELLAKAVEESKKNNDLNYIAEARRLMKVYGYKSALDLMK